MPEGAFNVLYMKCYNHPDRDAVATCTKCGKTLCKECADKHSPCLCDECYSQLREVELKNLQDAKKPFIKTIILGVVFLFVAFFIVAASQGPVWLPILAFFIPFGWKYANLLGLTWFFNLNAAGCAFMFLVYAFRACVAIIAGIPCFIIALVKLNEISKAAATAEIEIVSSDAASVEENKGGSL